MLILMMNNYYYLYMQTGWNPLIRASNEGNLKLVKIIADRGGQLNSQTVEVPDIDVSGLLVMID